MNAAPAAGAALHVDTAALAALIQARQAELAGAAARFAARAHTDQAGTEPADHTHAHPEGDPR